MNNTNLMNWLDSRKTHRQTTAHPAHKKYYAARGFDALFNQDEHQLNPKVRLEAQNLVESRIQEYSRRADKEVRQPAWA